MTTFLLVLWLITGAALATFYFLKQRSDSAAASAKQQAAVAWQESERAIGLARQETQEAVLRARGESESAVAYAQQTLEQKLAELAADSERVREHYEKEALKVHEAAARLMETTLAELAPLRGYA